MVLDRATAMRSTAFRGRPFRPVMAMVASSVSAESDREQAFHSRGEGATVESGLSALFGGTAAGEDRRQMHTDV